MGHHKKIKTPKDVIKSNFKAQRKLLKQNKTEKRARLVVKNLPFKTTEENLRKHFEQFGEIVNVKLLKKPDGKLVGCGFVQFKLVQKAAKAKFHANGKPFLGRNIECDFALPKDKYSKSNKNSNPDVKTEIKEETEVKTEVISDEENDVSTTKKIDTNNTELSDENSGNEALSDENSENESLNDEETDDESSDNKSDDESEKNEDKNEIQKPKVISNDVVEGKTVFIKNVPFSATNEDLKKCMLQFGPVYYALICVDKFTEHSKGTAFVKFVNKEDAEKCLEAGTELTLLSNILDCHRALNKNDLQKQSNEKKEQKIEHKDSRNLYLVKEGVILAGTKAAEGVSATDMAKRLQLEQYKTQMLRKLNMFISPDRLIIHNLPSNWNDSKLKALFLKYSGAKAVIKEAKIMRDMTNVDSKGIGKSKEYGFVTFTKHENALTALRALNNNPNIFGVHRRPIVSFSIENRTMINAKLKRLQYSQTKNPKSKKYDPTLNKKNNKLEDSSSVGVVQDFSGVTATPGVSKMRSKFNLKTQAQLHHKHLKMQKKKQKSVKKTLQQRKQDFIRQPQQKINKKNKEDDNFSKLVNEYKKKLTSPHVNNKKSKWYE